MKARLLTQQIREFCQVSPAPFLHSTHMGLGTRLDEHTHAQIKLNNENTNVGLALTCPINSTDQLHIYITYSRKLH